MKTGDFEFGQVGKGFEHEGLIDPQWTGHLHFFQLWSSPPLLEVISYYDILYYMCMI